MEKELSARQWDKIRRLHEKRGHECDRALGAIQRHDRIDYLFYRSGARAISKQIDELLIAWLEY